GDLLQNFPGSFGDRPPWAIGSVTNLASYGRAPPRRFQRPSVWLRHTNHDTESNPADSEKVPGLCGRNPCGGAEVQVLWICSCGIAQCRAGSRPASWPRSDCGADGIRRATTTSYADVALFRP